MKKLKRLKRRTWLFKSKDLYQKNKIIYFDMISILTGNKIQCYRDSNMSIGDYRKRHKFFQSKVGYKK